MRNETNDPPDRGAAGAVPLVASTARGRRPAHRRSATPGPVIISAPSRYRCTTTWATWRCVTDYSTDTPTEVVFDNAVGAQLVRKGYGDWSSVPTTAVGATSAGNFSQQGPAADRRDEHVPHHRHIQRPRHLRHFRYRRQHHGRTTSARRTACSGVSSPQYSIEGTTIITESWTILNGAAIESPGRQGGRIPGRRHARIRSLARPRAHTGERRGRVLRRRRRDRTAAPHFPTSAAPRRSDIETMYPYIDPTPGTGTGVGQGNIHTLDSMAGISDLVSGHRLALGLRHDRGQGLRSRRQDRAHRRQRHRAQSRPIPYAGRELGRHRPADAGSARARWQLRHSRFDAGPALRALRRRDHGWRLSDAAARGSCRAPNTSTATSDDGDGAGDSRSTRAATAVITAHAGETQHAPIKFAVARRCAAPVPARLRHGRQWTHRRRGDRGRQHGPRRPGVHAGRRRPASLR